MNVNVKNVDPDVLQRLAEQAAAEGMSQQEWIRQALRRTAARLSPAELSTQRETVAATSTSEFVAVSAKLAARRAESIDRLRASGRRR